MIRRALLQKEDHKMVLNESSKMIHFWTMQEFQSLEF